MKKKAFLVIAFLLLASMFVGCAAQNAASPDTGDSAAPDVAAKEDPEPAAPADTGDEVYVWACQYNSLPLFVNNDYIGMDLIAKELGVTVKKIGPQQVDLPAFIAAIEQEIPQKPNGMMVVGWDTSLKTAIDKAIDAGIPTITVDAPVYDSKALCHVGTDWYDLGVKQATQLAKYVNEQAGGTGKAVFIGLPGNDNTFKALDGFTATFAKLCPEVTVDQKIYDTQSSSQVVAETVTNLLKADSSIVAIGGFDSSAGPGIAQAIVETGNKGKVFGTCVDAEMEHLQALKDGGLVGAIGQKRINITYYGVRMLYDYVHNGIRYTEDDKAAGITPIPERIATGFIIATPENVDLLIEAAKAKSTK